MLNHNKRSITVDAETQSKELLERLIRHCDVLVENFAPARWTDGVDLGADPEPEPRMIVAREGIRARSVPDCKVYENVAQCAGGSARPPA